MKKNLFFGLFALATMLFTASCQEEDLAGASAGNTSTVTFEVSTPMIATRAVGDGNTAKKLYVAVYENQNGTLQGPLDVSLIDEGETVAFNERVATVNLALAKNKEYSVVFWAETENNEEAMFDIDWANSELTIKTNDEGEYVVNANQEKYDAFWAQKKVEISGAISEKVELKRPFAQLNIGTSDKAEAAAAGIVVEKTQVVVSGACNIFNLQTGAASGEADVTYTMAAIADIEGETFPAVTNPVQSYLSLNYLLMGEDKSPVDMVFSYMDAQDAAPYTLTFASVPMQRNYRTNIYGTLLTNSANYTVEILPGFGQNGEEDAANIVYAKTAEEMAAALTADEENIEVRLLNDIELPISSLGTQTGGSGEYKLGGEKTQNITIDMNGKKLTVTTTYWSVLGAKNANALFTIKNGTMTSSQASGTWNSYDLEFANCNYAIEDVVFEKAIAFTSGADKNISVKNVTINETHDYYGMWISAKGQVIDIDGLTINSAGRGIKIDEQYVAEPVKVTMNVNNLTVKSEKKAAIVVKSVEGAEISLANVDLSGVKADGFYAVWVDENSKDYADKVVVTGGFVKVEGAEDTAETNPFLVEGSTVNVAKGVYSALPKVANNVTIIAEEGTVFTGTSSVAGENVTIKNVRFTNTVKGSDNEYKALTGSLRGTVFENCHFDAKHGARYCYAYGEVVFNSCTFGNENCTRGVHFDDGDGSVTFNGCTLYGFQALAGGVEMMTFNDCVFAKNNNYNVVNMYSTYEFNNCQFNPEMNADCAGNGVVAAFNGCSYTDGKNIYSLVRFDKDPATCTITFDGTPVASVSTPDQLNSVLGLEDNITIYLAKGEFGTIVAKSDKTIIGSANAKVDCVNLNGADNVTLKNINFDAAKAQPCADFNGTYKVYANIMTGIYGHEQVKKGAHNLVIEGCTFSGAFKEGKPGASIAFTDYHRTSGYSGNITIKGCIFNTVQTYGGYDIYGYYVGDGPNGHGDFIIENNTFKTSFPNGQPIYLGRYASSTPVVVKGNTFETVSSLENAVYVQDHSNYGVSVDAANNTFAE